MKTLKVARFDQVANSYEDIYLEDPKLKIHNYADSFYIIDIEDALKPGSLCFGYTLRGNRGSCDILNWLRGFDYDWKKIIFYLHTIEFKQSRYGGFDEYQLTPTIKVYKGAENSNGVFSPFNLHHVKPLKSLPKKWTMTHVYKALLNGQFTDLKCDGVYSDDYAYDNAFNFQKGKLNSINFAKRIIESKSGWRCYESDGVVHVNCHSFDTNSFRPTILRQVK